MAGVADGMETSGYARIHNNARAADAWKMQSARGAEASVRAEDGKAAKGGSNPDMKKAQLKELLTQYGPIEYIWFDHAVGDGGLSRRYGTEAHTANSGSP